MNDILSINNNQFHLYVDSIYPNKLEIKDTTDCSISASYLDILCIKFHNSRRIAEKLLRQL
jgi:hypothetical protein